MSLTIGFVMRFENYPPAVAVPPLVQRSQVMHPIIEAQKVVAVKPVVHISNNEHNHSMQQSNDFSSRWEPEPTLTYSKQG